MSPKKLRFRSAIKDKDLSELLQDLGVQSNIEIFIVKLMYTIKGENPGSLPKVCHALLNMQNACLNRNSELAKTNFSHSFFLIPNPYKANRKLDEDA